MDHKKKKKNKNTTQQLEQSGSSLSANDQSIKATANWLSKRAALLIVLCFLSAGATASLQVANSKLFGMDVFDMGLSKYSIDKTARHRLWLTVIFENIPQIFISVAYAYQLAGFEPTVMFALLSSRVSVILAIFTALMESKTLSFLSNCYYNG